MKRIQEKVKDLVEVRPYRSLHDFLSDPARNALGLSFYRPTSDMMAKWLDKVAEVQVQSGAAKALAGYRGVGKSHFLATLGAIVSHPELRSRVTDPHVAASAQRLKRRRHPVAYVRRGTHATLLEELKDALALAIRGRCVKFERLARRFAENGFGQSGRFAVSSLSSTRLLTAPARVSRDDGVLLGELAELAKNHEFVYRRRAR